MFHEERNLRKYGTEEANLDGKFQRTLQEKNG